MANILLSRQFQMQLKGWPSKFGILKTSTANVKLGIPAQYLASCTAPVERKSNHTLLSSEQNVTSGMILKRFNADVSGHDHVKHWTAERALTVVLLSSIPAAIMFPSPVFEYFLALSLSVHSHWGIEALVVDYIRPSVFGKVIPKLSVAAIYGLSMVTFGGLCYFIYTDVGLINAVKLLWKL